MLSRMKISCWLCNDIFCWQAAYVSFILTCNKTMQSRLIVFHFAFVTCHGKYVVYVMYTYVETYVPSTPYRMTTYDCIHHISECFQ